jgi:hypothetical protein
MGADTATRDRAAAKMAGRAHVQTPAARFDRPRGAVGLLVRNHGHAVHAHDADEVSGAAISQVPRLVAIGAPLVTIRLWDTNRRIDRRSPADDEGRWARRS